MTDPVSVCNQAVLELGGGEWGSPLMQSLNENTQLAIACKAFFADARDMVLEMHPWNFCAFKARLARHTESPVMTWMYMYPLDTDPFCIKVRHTDRTDQGLEDNFEVGMHSIYGRMLFSNASSVMISYTGRVDDLNIWSPLAVQVLIKIIASKLAKPLTGQNSLTQMKLQEAQMLLPEARGSDGREGSPMVLAANHILTNSRHGLASWRIGSRNGD